MNPLIGTKQLVRLALRRDRIILPVWILALSFLPSATVKPYDQFYPTQASRIALQAGAERNPSFGVLYGQAFDLTTPGGFVAWRTMSFLVLLVGMMAIFTVTRHTRAEEDTGRLELLSSTVVGRWAALTAAGIVASGTSAVIGALVTVSLLGAGVPAAGSITMGVGTFLVGATFAGIAAIAAQLAEFSRSANMIASAALGLAFLLRAAGDSSPDARWLSWLSPIGWAQQVRPFAGERWWVLGLLIIAAVGTATVSYVLLPRRDLGAGILPARPGPAEASAGLRSPFALAWRLHRAPLLAWTAGLAIMGAVFGSIASGVGDLIGDSPQAREMFERMGGSHGLINAFIAAIAGIFGIVVAVYATTAVIRMRSEETAVRAEPLLATRVTRLGWAASHLVFAFAGTAVLLFAAGLGLGLGHGLRTGTTGDVVPDALTGTLAQLPAVWVVAAIASVLFGLFPKLMTAAWAPVIAFLLIGMFGPVLQFSQAAMDISPFTHIPKLPGSEFTATPLLWLTGIAVVVLAAGMTGFRRRDIG